jgi:deoxyribodipyrimidine photolyase-like uncharacterized protein
MGWRDYVWHLYWHLGEDYRHANRLGARRHLPGRWQDLDATRPTPLASRTLSPTCATMAGSTTFHG